MFMVSGGGASRDVTMMSHPQCRSALFLVPYQVDLHAEVYVFMSTSRATETIQFICLCQFAVCARKLKRLWIR